MVDTVAVNGLTLCHKHSTGYVRSTLPDVCKSPSEPVPYINTAFAATLADGTTTVFSNGGAMNGVLGSRFATSVGDEPGVGGGVISGTFMAEATFISFSPNVFMQGRAVTRLTDKMLLNHANTVSIGGYYTGPITGPALPYLEYLCMLACECMGKGNQRCVELALMAVIKAGNDPESALWPELNIANDGTVMRNQDGSPSRKRAVPIDDATRMDVTQLQNGKPVYTVEMKFPRDRLRRGQDKRQDKASRAADMRRDVLDVDEDCDCAQKQPEPEPVPVPIPYPQAESEDNRNWVQRHPLLTLGLIGAAGVATWYAGGAGGEALAAALGPEAFASLLGGTAAATAAAH